MSNIEVLRNPWRRPTVADPLTEEQVQAVAACHRSMADYEPTPLLALKGLARELGLRGLHVKDESKRFGLNAFKGLGVSYAMHRILEEGPLPQAGVVSCTDGNHGKALAWMAKRLGCPCLILMPKGSSPARVAAIQALGATVQVTEHNYDDTVRLAASYAQEHGALLVQDTALPGYTKIPWDIVLGYSTLLREALEQLQERPTHVFVQAGVGSLAGGVIAYLNHAMAQGSAPLVGVIEAQTVPCIYESIRQGRWVTFGDGPITAMAGLNCGEANPVTFPIIRDRADALIQCADDITFQGMARAKNPVDRDPAFSSGESGAVGLGMVEQLMRDPAYGAQRQLLNLNSQSVVLLFNTEGEVAPQ